MRRLMTGCILLVAGAMEPLGACGPNFPVTLLDQRGKAMLQMPEGVFDFEATRLLTVEPRDWPVVEDGIWADPAELRARAETVGLIPSEVEELRALREAASLDQALRIGASLPADLGHYTLGAWAWHAGDLELASEQFALAAALPAPQDQRRGLWAQYMLGRLAAARGDAEAARLAFAATRERVSAGAADALGLAIASLGEEARVEWQQERYARAARLYAEQAARGSRGARASLLFLARAALGDHRMRAALLDDELGRGLLAVYLYARGHELHGDALWDDESLRDRPAARLGSLLDALAIQASGLRQADRLAAVAYRAGRFDRAQEFAAASQEPLAAWVRAKLALRDGDHAAAAAAYAEAAAAFPAEERWSVWDDTWDDDEALRPRCRVQAEAGTLALSRGDYVQAMELLYAAASEYWADAAYVAERVLTVDELRAFVDRVVAETPVLAADLDLGDAWSRRSAEPGIKLRWLLARRLVREGRLAEAIPYFDDPDIRAAAEGYRQAMAGTRAWTRVARARAWFEAAAHARWQGMEIMGYEGDPDYFLFGGSYDLNTSWTWDENWNQVWHARKDLIVEGPFTSEEERQRVAASRAQPLERFHYRLVAAAHAGKAADILPPRSQAFAAVLCEATRWLIDRQPEEAGKIYRRYLREGPYVDWGARFGRECPQPDFAKVEGEIRRWWMVRGSWAAAIFFGGSLLLHALLRLVRRRAARAA